MSSKIVLAVCVLVAVAAAASAQDTGAGGVNPWVPPWVATAPWYPQWLPCTTVGSTCLDCTTKMVCTKVGGLHRPCTDPTMPYCNLGECSATPTEGCGPAPVPAEAAA